MNDEIRLLKIEYHIASNGKIRVDLMMHKKLRDTLQHLGSDYEIFISDLTLQINHTVETIDELMARAINADVAEEKKEEN